MSVIIPDKLIFVTHPRTASIAVRDALLTLPGAEETLYHHGYVHEIDQRTGDEYKITTVRNPYDLMASWFEVNPNWEDFEDFLLNYSHSEMIKQGELFYHANDVDYVMFFEAIQEALDEVLSDLGLGRVPLKMVNTTPNKKPYQEYYNDRTRSIVNQLYHRELRKYNYSFSLPGE